MEPEADFTGEGGPCLAGHYCIAGSAAPTPCEPGTYTDATGQVSSCLMHRNVDNYLCSYFPTYNLFIIMFSDISCTPITLKSRLEFFTVSLDFRSGKY